MQNFTSEEMSLPHAEMLQLRIAGKLTLGMDNDVAAKILDTPGLGPTKTAANAAGHLWNWIAFGALVYSVYLSFTWHWWAFIPGIVVMRAISGANKISNSQNYLDAAMVDEDFYERIQSVGGWTYQMESKTAGDLAAPRVGAK